METILLEINQKIDIDLMLDQQWIALRTQSWEQAYV